MAESEFPGREEYTSGQLPADLLPRRSETDERRMHGSNHWGRQNGSAAIERQAGAAQRTVQALGWFSIGLGLSELALAGAVARLAGLDGSRALLRVLGAREILHGVGILSGRRPTNWVWSRVVGDAIDLALLGRAAVSPHASRRRVAIAAAAVAGVTAIDIKTGQQLSKLGAAVEKDRDIHIRKSFQINRPVQELYRFWRDFKNLPRIMQHLEAVEVTDDKRSTWTAKGPAGREVCWEAEITDDRVDEKIAWRSVEDAMVENSGSVEFKPAPGGRGSFVSVELNYRPPAGAFGAFVAKLFGEEPGLQLEEDLRRFKQIMETGEIITTEGQPAGRARSTSWKYDRLGRRLAAAF